MVSISFHRRLFWRVLPNSRKLPPSITSMIIGIFILVFLSIAYLASSRMIPRVLDCSRPCESNALKDARVGACTTRDAAPLAPRPHNFDPGRVYIAVGIITPDNEDHLKLRMWQRNGWFTYRDMMTVANGFSGKMFVEYIVGLNYEMEYIFSKSLLSEASKYRDILGVGVHELPRKKKTLLTTGFYGSHAELTMSMKVFAYYCYAERTYPNAKFVIKMDDDQYVRVPMTIRTADTLPWKGVFWGYKVAQRPIRRGPLMKCGVSGMHVAMSKDVLHLLNTYEPLQRLARVQLQGGKVVNTPGITMDYLFHKTIIFVEDVCTAAAVGELALLQNGSHIHYYKESSCRMHVLMDDKGRFFHHELNPHSMVVHHANESMEQDYIRLFTEDNIHDVQFTAAPSNETCYGRPVYEFKCK